MPKIITVTEIAAPRERVFDLCRSVDLHVQSAGSTGETAIAGVTTGLLELGDQVTWRGKHFGIWQNLTSKIVAYSRPDYFRDSMTEGAFRRLDHDHFFEEKGGTTVMKDVFDFSSPFGFLGQMADVLFLKAYMRRFIVVRNEVIKEMAEGTEWRAFVDDGG